MEEQPAGPMRRVVKAATTSGAASILAAVAGFVRIKLFAVFLGAAGVGVISQLQSLHNTLNVVAMLGLGTGISREVARRHAAGDTAGVRAVMATSRGIAGLAAIVLTLAVVVFARPLSLFLFDDPGHAWLLWLAIPALFCNTMIRILAETLNGHTDYAVNARVTVLSALFAAAVLVPLLPWLGLRGAALSLPAALVLSWMAMSWHFRRARPELRGSGFALHPPTAGALLAIGGAALVMATADQLGLLVVRSRLIGLHGVEANGWFQGVWGLSQYILNVAIAFQLSYSFARANAASGRAELIAETNRTVRMTLLMMAPMTAAMILLRGPLIDLFLSAEFRPALPLFAPTAAGTLMRAAGLAVGIGALAVAPLRVWLALGLSGPFTFLAAYLLLSERWGVEAAPIGYAISGAVHLSVAGLVMARYGALRLEPRVLALVATSAALLAGIYHVADLSPASYGWGGLLLLGWTLTSVSAREARQGVAAAIRRLRR